MQNTVLLLVFGLKSTTQLMKHSIVQSESIKNLPFLKANFAHICSYNVSIKSEKVFDFLRFFIQFS